VSSLLFYSDTNLVETLVIASLEGVKGSKRELEELRDNSITNFVETLVITSHHYVVAISFARYLGDGDVINRASTKLVIFDNKRCRLRRDAGYHVSER